MEVGSELLPKGHNMEIYAIALACLGISTAFSLIHCPVIMGMAHNYRWYDPVTSRKLHSEPIPRLGGIAIFGAFVLALLVISLRGPSPMHAVGGNLSLWPFVIGSFLIHILGVVDDFQNLRPRHKLFVETVAATLMVASGFHFHGCHLPWSVDPVPFGILSYPLSILWIVGVTNAMNLLDGMDGLAATVGGLASGAFAVLFLIHGNTAGACIAFALCGSLLGFLWFNWNPARMFMGDGGSLLVGFVLACLPLISQSDGTLEIGFISAVVILGLPILDTLNVITERVRTGRPVMSADQGHVHHRLLQLGLGSRWSLGVLGVLTLASCLSVVFASGLEPVLAFSTKMALLTLLAISIRLIQGLASRLRRPHPVMARRRQDHIGSE